MRNAKLQQGFTLVEMMVTVVLATVIIAALYLIYVQSVSAYRMENQFLDLQERSRFGLEHLKRDLRRAGFLASPNTLEDGDVCQKPDTDLLAVTLKVPDGQVVTPFSGANPNIQPASLTLFGDFYSGRTYRTSGIQDARVYLQESQEFPATEAEFSRIFSAATNRYLRIVTQDQFEIYLAIVASTWADRSVTLKSSVPMVGDGGGCGIAGFGEGLEVSVAGFVRYRVATDTRLPPGHPQENLKTDLIREELQVDGVAVVPGSQLVIADYVVDLQVYDLGFDIDPVGTAPLLSMYQYSEQVGDAGGGGILGTDGEASEAHNLRFLTAKLTVRTESEDEEFNYDPRANVHDPLDGYEITPMAGACRTLTLASRVELTSLAVRNMKEQGP